MEFDAQTQISTEDFSQALMDNIFGNGAGFSDEEGFTAPKDTANEEASELFDYSGTDAAGIDEDAITEALKADGIDDLIPTDFVEANELADFVAVNGERVEREVIEKALNAYSGYSEWGKNVNTHFEELDELEENISKMYQLSNSEINMYVEQLEGIVNNDKYDAVKRMEAYNELAKYKGQKAQIEKAYSENYAELQRKKANAEMLKGQAVSNELAAMGWKAQDFETTANFMIQNNIRLGAKDVSSSLMIALKKAALYDAGNTKLKEETKSNVQKAITGQAQRPSKAITPEDTRRKAKAAQMMKDGTLSTRDAFEFLTD